MCTLHCFEGSNADVKSRHIDQIERDWQRNSDGASVIMLDDHGECLLRFQTIKLKYLTSMLKSSKGTRYIVHLRASTTPTTGVSGCHCFDSESGEWIYAHNGIVYGHIASYARVDSLQLGHELDTESYVDGERCELPDWTHHNFANVIAYHTYTQRVFVHRSDGGSLHHDGNGNWSTVRINQHYNPVLPGWYTVHGECLVKYPESVHSPWLYRGHGHWQYKPDVSANTTTPSSSADDAPYVECDDCRDMYPVSSLSLWGQLNLCPKCYDWQTGGVQ